MHDEMVTMDNALMGAKVPTGMRAWGREWEERGHMIVVTGTRRVPLRVEKCGDTSATSAKEEKK